MKKIILLLLIGVAIINSNAQVNPATARLHRVV